MNEAPIIEWMYTLNKSIISKAFDQPDLFARKSKNARLCERKHCVNFFLLWSRTKEGGSFWIVINNKLCDE